MGGVSFKMDLSGLMEKIGTAAARAENHKELMDTIGETLVSSTQQRFIEGAAPDGTKWKLSQRVEKEGGQTLVKSGQLRASISYESSSKTVCVGTNKVYARIHQLGGKAGRGLKVTIPQREYIGISADDEDEIKELMMEELKSIFGAS